jgi:hypothetical protein
MPNPTRRQRSNDDIVPDPLPQSLIRQYQQWRIESFPAIAGERTHGREQESDDEDLDELFSDNEDNIETYVAAPGYNPYDNESVYNRSLFNELDLPIINKQTRENLVDMWFKYIEYRIRWIFQRQEKDGLDRQRFIAPFSPDDFIGRISKKLNPHEMDTETNIFYDWNIGGTDFTMRLESFNVVDRHCLRCHFIHNPSKTELCYQDRVWDGGMFREVNMQWAQLGESLT